MTVKRGSRVPLMHSGRGWVRGAEEGLRDLVRREGDRLSGMKGGYSRGQSGSARGRGEEECKRGCPKVSES